MKYDIIYADPAWTYDDKTLKRGGAERYYPCMSLQEICNLAVNDIASENSVLFLWVTMPFLQDCFKVIESWGFTYKTCAFVWIKANKRASKKQYSFLENDRLDLFLGMGRWTRSNAEICLLCTKGKPKRVNANIKQVIYSPIERHSKKPAETRDRIVSLIGDLPRVELFARDRVEGWHSWGNQIDSSIVL